MIIWTGSWFSKHQPWLSAGLSAVVLAVVIALVWWAQGLSAEPWLLALVLLVSGAVRATVDGRRWRRRREQLRTDGFTDEQLSAGEQVLRRGAAPTSPVEREAALHVAALRSKDLGAPVTELWVCGLLGAVLLGAAVLDTPRWLAALALLALAVAVSWVGRRRLDRRCGELLTQVAVRP